jgi:hypothetical protein
MQHFDLAYADLHLRCTSSYFSNNLPRLFNYRYTAVEVDVSCGNSEGSFAFAVTFQWWHCHRWP